MTCVDIGGGATPAHGCHNLDPAHGQGIWRRPIQDGIPLPDASVQAVRASHVLEHIPAGPERIALFNEVHRVLVPAGTFEVIVPLICGSEPGEPLHWAALADPTHVSFWVPASFEYFTGVKAACADYGIRLWEEVSFETRGGWEGRWVGRPR